MKRLSIISVLLILSMCLEACFAGKTELLLPNVHELSQNSDTVNKLIDGEVGWVGSDVCIPQEDSEYADENIKAQAGLVFSLDDTNVYYAKRVFKSMNPASLTTLFTAAVILNKRNLSDVVTITKEDVKGLSNASNVGLAEGDQVTVELLLNAMLLSSGIDAANALARSTAGSIEDFVTMMNDTAMEYGCNDSQFKNPSGLTASGHYTTAYDIYLIYHHLLADKRFVNIMSADSYKAVYKNAAGQKVEREYRSTVNYAQEGIKNIGKFKVIGGKTGTTAAAGHCLALQVQDNDQKDYLLLLMKAATKDSLYEQIEYIVEKIKN